MQLNLTAMLISSPIPLYGKLTSEFTPQFSSNKKNWVFHLETLETKLTPVWKTLMIMLRYIHQAQQTNTYSRSAAIATLEQGMKHAQSWQ